MNILVAIHSPVALWNIPNGHVEWLRRTFPEHTFLHAASEGEALALIAGAEVATELFALNLRRFEAGEPLLNVVDKQAGY